MYPSINLIKPYSNIFVYLIIEDSKWLFRNKKTEYFRFFVVYGVAGCSGSTVMIIFNLIPEVFETQGNT